MSLMVAELRGCSTASAVMAEYVQRVGGQPSEILVGEWNLLSATYKNAVGNQRAALRVITSVEQKETSKGDEQLVLHAREYVAKVEGELQKIRDGILALMDENLIPSSSTGELKEKGLITYVINRLQTSTDLKGFDMMIAVRWFIEQEHSAIMRFGAGADDDPLVKVKDLIMDFSRLQEEASSEAYCNEETLKGTEKENLEAETEKHSSTLETPVSEGHPDEIYDQTSDVVIDACLTCDAKYKVASETCVKDNTVMVEREIPVMAQRQIPIDQTVQQTVETPQLQYIDEMIDVPVVSVVQVPRARVS